MPLKFSLTAFFYFCLMIHEHYHKWYTQYLSRDFEMLVFGFAGLPVILFPPFCGRYYDCKDFGLINSAEHLLDSGKIKIYCPDTVDSESWHNYNIHPSQRVKTHMAYEQCIIHDVIEFAKYETEYEQTCLSGCDFGAYHALNLSFRHPELVNHLICLSGAFDIKPYILGYYDDNCYFNNPPDYMPGLTDSWYLDRMKKMKIILGIGEWDKCLEENRRMSDLLKQKQISHLLDVRHDAGHNWQVWKDMFPDYVRKIG